MPMRSWHSVAVVASVWCMVCMSGKASFIMAMPCSVAAIRGSVCSVSFSGGGTGAADSQVRSDRNWGSAATSWLRAVVPVRGRPMTKTGPSIDLVVDLGMETVGLLDPQSGGQEHAQPHLLHGLAHLGESALLVHRRHQALESLAVVVAAGVVEARLGPGVLLDPVDVESHRANRRLTAFRRMSMAAARSLGETRRVSGGNSSASRSNGTTLVVGHRGGLRADASQDDRPLAVPGGVEPIGDARVLMGHHHPHLPVVVHHGLKAVEARLVVAVVDRLPPDVAQRVAPVQALRRRDLDDQRLIGRRASTNR